MKRSSLPPRSFEIHPAFVKSRRIAVGICVVILVAVTALALYIASDIFAMRREAEIWAHGTPAPDARVDADGEVKVAFVHYKVRVDYRSGETEHAATQEFITIGAGGRIDRRGTLRYDAASPDAFATSVGIESVAGRWRWIAGMGGFLVIVGVIMALQIRRSHREIGRVRALGSDGDEIVATILTTDKVTLSNGRATPYVRIKWQAGGHGPFTTQLDTRKGTAAQTARAGEAIAMLAPDGTHGMLLRSDLYPLLATPDEIQAAAARRTQAS